MTIGLLKTVILFAMANGVVFDVLIPNTPNLITVKLDINPQVFLLKSVVTRPVHNIGQQV